MTPFVAGVIASLLGAIVGGAVSWLLNRQLHAQQLGRLRTEYKTEFAAEDTARHFLGHKGYTDRSFDVLRKHLGGYEDDELRRTSSAPAPCGRSATTAASGGGCSAAWTSTSNTRPARAGLDRRRLQGAGAPLA